MKKEEKKNAVNDNEIESVAGGYVEVNKGAGKNGEDTYTLRGDGRGENQGTFSDINELNAMAKRLGTNTNIRGYSR